MHARLQGLGRFVQKASGVPHVGPRPVLKAMVGVTAGAVRLGLGVRQVAYRVADRAPRLLERRQEDRPPALREPGTDGAVAGGHAMTVPILASAELIEQERVVGVCRVGECPAGVDIRPEADEDDALTLLRNSKIGGVQEPMNHAVFNLAARGVVPIKSPKVIGPILVSAFRDGRMLQLQEDIPEIVGERLPRQTLHVLEDESPRPRLPNDAGGLAPHVAIVVMGAVKPANGKRLAWRPARHDIGRALVAREIQRADIGLGRCWPVADRRPRAAAVLTKRLATPLIAFDDDQRSESSHADADTKPAGSREQLNGAHRFPPTP